MNTKKKETKPETSFLRTALRKDLYARFEEFAKQFSTGNGYWDFGVAIQILLDHYDESKLAIQSEKIDQALFMLQQLTVEKDNNIPPTSEEDFEEMIGGIKLNKKTGEIICRDIKK